MPSDVAAQSAPRRNRVDPWGDVHAVTARGLFTGNRGCLVDASGRLARHHQGNLWITCLLSFRGWSHPLDAPRRWTPLFFLDDAVALAAGHRPCATCRRDAYRSYREAVALSARPGERVGALELNGRLAAERLRPGRGLQRAEHRKLWCAPFDALPDGAVIVDRPGNARLVLGDRTLAFSPTGWTSLQVRPSHGMAHVLTPPTSVAALRHGFEPVLHPSASA